jgi:hypothetical protein
VIEHISITGHRIDFLMEALKSGEYDLPIGRYWPAMSQPSRPR